MHSTAEGWAARCRSLYPVPDCVPHGVALDIGANIGGFPLAYHDRFERIICVEPCTETFRTLVENTASLGNVFCLNLALGRGNRFVPLRRHTVHPHDTACYSTRFHSEWGEVVQHVPTANLSDLLSLCGACGVKSAPLSFLKMDCEGAEYDALDVHMGLLNEHIVAIGIELHAQWPERRAWAKQQLEAQYDVHHHTFVDPHDNIVYVRKS